MCSTYLECGVSLGIDTNKWPQDIAQAALGAEKEVKSSCHSAELRILMSSMAALSAEEDTKTTQAALQRVFKYAAKKGGALLARVSTELLPRASAHVELACLRRRGLS